MQVLILGARGFIGGRLVEFLRRERPLWNVISAPSLDFNPAYLSQYFENLLSKLDSPPDLVINCFWIGTSRNARKSVEIQNNNSLFLNELIKQINYHTDNRSRIVLFGSQAELSPEETPWSESSPMLPYDAYGFAKKFCFESVLKSGLPFSWIRLFSVYGPNDRRDWIVTKVLNALLKKEPLKLGSCNQIWPLTHVDDVCSGILGVIELKLHGIINLTNRENVTLRASMEFLQNLSGQHGIIEFSNDQTLVKNLIVDETLLEIKGYPAKIPIFAGLASLWEDVSYQNKFDAPVK